MAGKTKINGTAYTIKGGKTKVGGTGYSVKQGKTLIGGTSKTISFWNPSAHKRVGGRIFYVNSSSTNSYTFYTSDGTVLTTHTVAGLANAYYYDKSGSSVDKFYVYDNTSHTYSGVSITNGISTKSLRWGYKYTTTSVTSDSIGSGKTNTQTILNRGVPTDYTPNIWGYVKYCRDNSLNGCTDWFIASADEQTQLRTSGLVDWYAAKYLWASAETAYDLARIWIWDGPFWGETGKDFQGYAFAARAF